MKDTLFIIAGIVLLLLAMPAVILMPNIALEFGWSTPTIVAILMASVLPYTGYKLVTYGMDC